jgi:hypothetical protein
MEMGENRSFLLLIAVGQMTAIVLDGIPLDRR